MKNTNKRNKTNFKGQKDWTVPRCSCCFDTQSECKLDFNIFTQPPPNPPKYLCTVCYPPANPPTLKLLIYKPV